MATNVKEFYSKNSSNIFILWRLWVFVSLVMALVPENLCSVTLVKDKPDFPFFGCHTEEIDLVFMADSAVDGFPEDPAEVTNEDEDTMTTERTNHQTGLKSLNTTILPSTDELLYDSTHPQGSTDNGNSTLQDQNVHAYLYENYISQMKLFSNILDVFLRADETKLTRVKVALLASVGMPSLNITSVPFSIRFDLNKYKDRTEVRKAIEADVMGSPPFSLPLYTTQLILTDLLTDKNFGFRNGSMRIIIVCIGHYADFVHLHKLDMNLFNTDDVKVMFLTSDFVTAFLMATYVPENNVIAIHSSQFPIENQNIPLALCAVCSPGWFKFQTSDMTSYAFGTESCYKIILAEEETNWLDSRQLCTSFEANMVSLQTKTETQNVRKELQLQVIELLSNTTGLVKKDGSRTKVDLFIGLRRETGGFKKLFRWLDGPPLIYSHWGNEEPSGGYSQACVVWTFFLTTSDSFTPKQDVDIYDSISEDAWYTVPCGRRNTRAIICESIPPSRYTDSASQVAVTGKPSENSVNLAIARGEIGVTYLVENPEAKELLISAATITERYEEGESETMQNSAFINHNKAEMLSEKDLKLFRCENSYDQTITYALVCDGREDCSYGFDESICSDQTCFGEAEFMCMNEQCVPRESRCDLYPDCNDGSDEEECDECKHMICPDGGCIPKSWFSDGEIDCNAHTYDSVQEEMASTGDEAIGECVMTCNKTKCVYPYMMGDGVVDCQGLEGPIDETIGGQESTTCYNEDEDVAVKYSNWAPRCLYVKDIYGGVIGCANMKHLQDCEDFVCPEGYVKCPNSYCIPIHYVEDSEMHCPFGEDETNISLNCTGYFQCRKCKTCIHPKHVCDNYPHCPFGDDEINCHVSCKDGFLCLAGTVTVLDYDRNQPLEDLTFIDDRTRYIDLSGIDLSLVIANLPENHFRYLMEANFSRCNIKSVEVGELWRSLDVRLLDMSRNLIEKVPTLNMFKYMESLYNLDLSFNIHLKRIESEAFPIDRYSNLRILDLSFTSLFSLEATTIEGLNNLKYLCLRGTKITIFSSDMFPRGFQFQVLDLREIPFQGFSMDTFEYITIISKLYTDSYKLCCPQIHNLNTKAGTCESPKDVFSSCSDLMSEMVLRLLLWVNGFMAVLGNSVVIGYRLCYDKTVLKAAYGHFVTHLGIADFMMGVYLLMIASADSYYRGSYVGSEQQWRNSVICKMAGFLSTMACELSAFFICLITVDRVLVIKYPFGQVRMSAKAIRLFCFAAWSVAIIIALIPLLPPFSYWNTYTSNGMCLGLPLTTVTHPGWQYSFTIFILLNFSLFTLISLGQLLIYRTITAAKENIGLQVANPNSRRAQDLTVAKNLFLIAMTNFLCWFPVGVTGLLAITGHEIGQDSYAWLAVLVLPVNSAINPLIYTIPALKRQWKARIQKPSRGRTSTDETKSTDKSWSTFQSSVNN